MNWNKLIYGFCLISSINILLMSCQKEITIDLPSVEKKLVIEGTIEADGVNPTPPVVMLTKSEGYFEPTGASSLENIFVHDATVSIKVDNVVYPLEEICLDNLDSTLALIAANFLGISPDDFGNFNYCFYTVPISDLFANNYLYGEIGKAYELTVLSEGITYTSTTHIPQLIPLDSVWFQTQGSDTAGFAWATLTDPPEMGNAYRWKARRINLNKDGETKDNQFISPANSVFEDKFVNGVSFDFGYDRGLVSNDENTDVPRYFKTNDTIAIKFCSIDYETYQFLRIYEVEINSSGSPFSSPTTIPTNITGGALGLWAGYSVTFDTIYGY